MNHMGSKTSILRRPEIVLASPGGGGLSQGPPTDVTDLGVDRAGKLPVTFSIQDNLPGSPSSGLCRSRAALRDVLIESRDLWLVLAKFPCKQRSVAGIGATGVHEHAPNPSSSYLAYIELGLSRKPIPKHSFPHVNGPVHQPSLA